MGHFLSCRPFVAYYTKFQLSMCIFKIMPALAKKTVTFQKIMHLLCTDFLRFSLAVSVTFIRHSNKILQISAMSVLANYYEG